VATIIILRQQQTTKVVIYINYFHNVKAEAERRSSRSSISGRKG